MSVFNVLSDPTRRQILDILSRGDTPVGAIVDELSISQPVVSKHLRVLRDASLVNVQKDGQRRLYRLHAAPMAEMDQWLTPYRRFWADHLDALADHLDHSGEP